MALAFFNANAFRSISDSHGRGALETKGFFFLYAPTLVDLKNSKKKQKSNFTIEL